MGAELFQPFDRKYHVTTQLPSSFIQTQSQVHEAHQLHCIQWFKDSKEAYFTSDMGTQAPSLELLHENVSVMLVKYYLVW